MIFPRNQHAFHLSFIPVSAQMLPVSHRTYLIPPNSASSTMNIPYVGFIAVLGIYFILRPSCPFVYASPAILPVLIAKGRLEMQKKESWRPSRVPCSLSCLVALLRSGMPWHGPAPTRKEGCFGLISTKMPYGLAAVFCLAENGKGLGLGSRQENAWVRIWSH